MTSCNRKRRCRRWLWTEDKESADATGKYVDGGRCRGGEPESLSADCADLRRFGKGRGEDGLRSGLGRQSGVFRPFIYKCLNLRNLRNLRINASRIFRDRSGARIGANWRWGSVGNSVFGRTQKGGGWGHGARGGCCRLGWPKLGARRFEMADLRLEMAMTECRFETRTMDAEPRLRGRNDPGVSRT